MITFYKISLDIATECHTRVYDQRQFIAQNWKNMTKNKCFYYFNYNGIFR